nr:hypothetical protein [Candidatus Sigynarchaeota archaeon]
MSKKTLRDTYTVRKSGRSLQFTINPNIVEELKIREGEIFQILLFKVKRAKTGEIIENIAEWFPAKLSTKGTSKRITIKAQVVKNLDLKEEDSISIEISKEL